MSPPPLIKYGWIILGPDGNIWNEQLFASEDEARKYMKDYTNLDLFTFVKGGSAVFSISDDGCSHRLGLS